MKKTEKTYDLSKFSFFKTNEIIGFKKSKKIIDYIFIGIFMLIIFCVSEALFKANQYKSSIDYNASLNQVFEFTTQNKDKIDPDSFYKLIQISEPISEIIAVNSLFNAYISHKYSPKELKAIDTIYFSNIDQRLESIKNSSNPLDCLSVNLVCAKFNRNMLQTNSILLEKIQQKILAIQYFKQISKV